MTARPNVFTEKEDNKFNQAIKHSIFHHSIEVLGLTVAGFFIILFYGILTLLRGDIGTNASKMLDHFVEHAISSINVGLLTAAIFVLSLTLIFDGAKVAGFLQNFVVRPLLNLFQHSCALTLGVSIGYLVLAVLGLKPLQEYRSALFVIFMMLFVIAALIFMRTFFEVFAKQLCVRICTVLVSKMFPKLATSPEKLNSRILASIAVVFVTIGLLLFATTTLQIPTDLKTGTKSLNPVIAEACSSHAD